MLFIWWFIVVCNYWCILLLCFSVWLGFILWFTFVFDCALVVVLLYVVLVCAVCYLVVTSLLVVCDLWLRFGWCLVLSVD